MPGSSCREMMNCQECPKAVENPIIHISHPRGFHIPVQKCEENFMLFLLKGEILINSNEYAGVVLKSGEFILQAIGSKIEMLIMQDADVVYYRFHKPELICDDRYRYIMTHVPPPLIYSPLRIVSQLKLFLEGTRYYLKGEKICRDLLSLKRKELGFVLGYYYDDYSLSTLVHPLAHYASSFHCFVLENHAKVKTVEEFAKLGGYTVTTFRRIFTDLFREPVYEWMVKQRKKAVLDELHHTQATISEICYKYGFESLPHFSNFCKKNFGASPRNLRAGVDASQ